MSLGHLLVYFKRSQRTLLYSGEGLPRWENGNVTKHDKGVGEPHICQRIVWVYRQGLLEAFKAFLQSFRGPLVPVVAPLEKGLIGFVVLSISLYELLSLFS